MVCIYCGGETAVKNSRPQKRLGHIWRRRLCTVCHATFTTHEIPDLAASLLVLGASGSLAPFQRDKLYSCVVRSLGHRDDAVAAASALTATIIASLLRQHGGASIARESIVQTSHLVLQRLDRVAGVQYAAYHPITVSSAIS
jgi:transcriptional regulator NrdR family protein